MVGDMLSKMTFGRWITLAVVLAAIGFVSLTQFTSFQIPKTLTESKQEPSVGGGLNLGGSTNSRTNLDEVYDIINEDKPSGTQPDRTKETGDAN